MVDHPVREREAEGHHERREHGERGCFGGRCDELPEPLEVGGRGGALGVAGLALLQFFHRGRRAAMVRGVYGAEAYETS